MQKPLLALFLLLSSLGFCQMAEMKFQHLTVGQGLSNNSVNSILQDHEGFVWIGTDYGLNRYDAYQFKTFIHEESNPKSLSANAVYSLLEDNAGRLWVGTTHGVDLFDRELEQFCDHLLGEARVKCFFQDSKGRIWAGSEKQGLFLYDEVAGKFQKNFRHADNDPTSLPCNHVTSMAEDSLGRMWIGTECGIALFDEHHHAFRSLDELEGAPIQPIGPYIFSMIYSSTDELYVTTYGKGLYRLNPYNFTHKTYTKNSADRHSLNSNALTALLETEDGRIWVGTDGGGLNILDPKTEKFTIHQRSKGNSQSLSSNVIRCLATDTDGDIWIGTFRGGANFENPHTDAFGHHKNLPTLNDNTSVVSFAHNEDGLWIGTDGGGLIHLDIKRQIGRLYTYAQDDSTSISHNSVVSLALQSDNKYLWAGTYSGGLNRMDLETKEVVRLKHDEDDKNSISSNIIWGLLWDSKDRLWVGTHVGLDLYDKENNTFIHLKEQFPELRNPIRVLFEDSTHRIWVGTEKGLFVLNAEATKLETILLEEERERSDLNWIVSLYEEPHGTIWAGSFGGGLMMINPETHEYRRFTEKDGLANNIVCGILSDRSGNLWISTQKGMSKLYLRKKIFQNFTEGDGLQSQQFNLNASLKTKQDALIFGGINGFNYFRPEDIIPNTHKPEIVFTSLKLSSKEVVIGENSPLHKHINYTDQVVVGHDDHIITIEFAALNYSQAGNNQYAYMLKGFDQEWNYVGQKRTATYTNLDPGTYTFRVKASNSDGVWNDEGRSLTIIIEPPFWGTWWFKLIMFSLLIGLGYFYYRYQLQIRLRQDFKKKLDERTEDLRKHMGIIEEQQRNLTDSINYAQRIQEAILPQLENIKECFPESFVMYLPRDIVSGDFYWFGKQDGKTIIAAVDCTGHGVPGAFMSLVGHQLLNNIINHHGITEPDHILSHLNLAVRKALNHDITSRQDGMDIALITYDEKQQTIEFAGANNPLIYVKDGELHRIRGDRRAIGGHDQHVRFTKHVIEIDSPISLYLFSDGYQDQFGGPKGKKFMVSNFREMLHEVHSKPMNEQKQDLFETLCSWMGNEHKQVDDILIIGLRLGEELEKSEKKSDQNVQKN